MRIHLAYLVQCSDSHAHQLSRSSLDLCCLGPLNAKHFHHIASQISDWSCSYLHQEGSSQQKFSRVMNGTRNLLENFSRTFHLTIQNKCPRLLPLLGSHRYCSFLMWHRDYSSLASSQDWVVYLLRDLEDSDSCVWEVYCLKKDKLLSGWVLFSRMYHLIWYHPILEKIYLEKQQKKVDPHPS